MIKGQSDARIAYAEWKNAYVGMMEKLRNSGRVFYPPPRLGKINCGPGRKLKDPPNRTAFIIPRQAWP